MDTKTSHLPVRLYLCRTTWRTTWRTSENGKRLVFTRFHVREALSEAAAKRAEHAHNKARNQELVAEGWTPTVSMLPLGLEGLDAETPAEFILSTQEDGGDKPVRRFRVRVEEILSADTPVDPESIPNPDELRSYPAHLRGQTIGELIKDKQAIVVPSEDVPELYSGS